MNFPNLTTVCRLFATVLALLVCSSAIQADADSHSTIEQQVAASIQQSYLARVPESRVEVTVNPVNKSLSLSPCSVPLQIELPFSSGERVTAKATCHAPRQWSLFLTARVQQYMTVVTARRPLPRNARLTGSELALSEQNITRLDGDYFTRLQDVMGLTTRTPVGNGEILSPRQLEASLAINKGDAVTIEARNGALLIRTQGTALEEGRRGQQISVRNNRSGREVRGTVIAPGIVRVN